MIVTDNGANMKKAVNDMGSISQNIRWQPCAAHTLQLIVGKGFKYSQIINIKNKTIDQFFLMT